MKKLSIISLVVAFFVFGVNAEDNQSEIKVFPENLIFQENQVAKLEVKSCVKTDCTPVSVEISEEIDLGRLSFTQVGKGQVEVKKFTTSELRNNLSTELLFQVQTDDGKKKTLRKKISFKAKNPIRKRVVTLKKQSQIDKYYQQLRKNRAARKAARAYARKQAAQQRRRNAARLQRANVSVAKKDNITVQQNQPAKSILGETLKPQSNFNSNITSNKSNSNTNSTVAQTNSTKVNGNFAKAANVNSVQSKITSNYIPIKTTPEADMLAFWQWWALPMAMLCILAYAKFVYGYSDGHWILFNGKHLKSLIYVFLLGLTGLGLLLFYAVVPPDISIPIYLQIICGVLTVPILGYYLFRGLNNIQVRRVLQHNNVDETKDIPSLNIEERFESIIDEPLTKSWKLVKNWKTTIKRSWRYLNNLKLPIWRQQKITFLTILLVISLLIVTVVAANAQQSYKIEQETLARDNYIATYRMEYSVKVIPQSFHLGGVNVRRLQSNAELYTPEWVFDEAILDIARSNQVVVRGYGNIIEIWSFQNLDPHKLINICEKVNEAVARYKKMKKLPHRRSARIIDKDSDKLRVYQEI